MVILFNINLDEYGVDIVRDFVFVYGNLWSWDIKEVGDLISRGNRCFKDLKYVEEL